ncbi:MAG: hypothetical protein AB1468_04200, partial [Candidatus Micrarchaeota archaeon]
ILVAFPASLFGCVKAAWGCGMRLFKIWATNIHQKEKGLSDLLYIIMSKCFLSLSLSAREQEERRRPEHSRACVERD